MLKMTANSAKSSVLYVISILMGVIFGVIICAPLLGWTPSDFLSQLLAGASGAAISIAGAEWLRGRADKSGENAQLQIFHSTQEEMLDFLDIAIAATDDNEDKHVHVKFVAQEDEGYFAGLYEPMQRLEHLVKLGAVNNLKVLRCYDETRKLLKDFDRQFDRVGDSDYKNDECYTDCVNYSMNAVDVKKLRESLALIK